MIDDLKYIHTKDGQDALGIAEKQWQQVEQIFDINTTHINVENIVFCGMGGSALAAQQSTSWPGYNCPFEIVRNYNLPAYVSRKNLVIASSYSGNTEETLSALEQAEQKGAQIAVIASGGKLADIAKAKGYTLAQLPSGLQPRYATLLNFKALVTLLDAFGLTAGKSAELTSKSEFLKQSVQEWLPTVPVERNQAKKIAQELMGKSAVIYSGPQLFPAAYKWKISINENAKQIAWCNQLPEANHNEILGWTEQPVQKPYAVIDIRSNLDNQRIQKRFEITQKLLSGKRPAPIVINPKGESLLEQMLWAVTLGDFVSLYLAILNGLNPTPVEIIEKLKKELAD